MRYRAVIFDLGGVVFPSPFEAFDAYDAQHGLDRGTVRALIRTSSEEGAWAALERGELTMPQFATALEAEAEAGGFRLDAMRLIDTLTGRFGPRPRMVRAIERIREEGLRTAALTNNWAMHDASPGPGRTPTAALAFDVVVESAVEGVRKPDPLIYELTLDRLGVAATESAFLDDLGINLKPARAMGMTTIKVTGPDAALDELAAVLGFALS